MEILLNGFQIGVTPESIYDCIFGRAMMRARSDKAKNVTCAPGSPSIRREGARAIPKDFNRAQHVNSQIEERRSGNCRLGLLDHNGNRLTGGQAAPMAG